VEPHGQIRVKEAARTRLVRPYPSDFRRQMKHQIRAGVVEEPLDRLFSRQIVLLTPRDDDLSAIQAPQPLDDVRSQESSASSDEDTSAAPEVACRFLLGHITSSRAVRLCFSG
jgi:hypothetical protein